MLQGYLIYTIDSGHDSLRRCRKTRYLEKYSEEQMTTREWYIIMIVWELMSVTVIESILLGEGYYGEVFEGYTK